MINQNCYRCIRNYTPPSVIAQLFGVPVNIALPAELAVVYLAVPNEILNDGFTVLELQPL